MINFEEEYIKHYEDARNNIISNITTHNNITTNMYLFPTNFTQVVTSIANDPQIHSHLTNILLTVSQVNDMLINLNTVMDNYEGELTWVPVWKICFKHKTNTNFYERLLEESVQINNDTSSPILNAVTFNKTGTAKYFKQIIIKTTTYTSTETPNDKLKLIEYFKGLTAHINKMYQVYACLYYMFARYALTCCALKLGSVTQNASQSPSIDDITKILNTMDKNLNKSSSHTYDDHYKTYYPSSSTPSSASTPATSTSPTSTDTNNTTITYPEQKASIWFEKKELENVNTFLSTQFGKITKKITLPKDGDSYLLFFSEYMKTLDRTMDKINPSKTIDTEALVNATVESVKKNAIGLATNATDIANRLADMLQASKGLETIYNTIGEKLTTSSTPITLTQILAMLNPTTAQTSSTGGGNNTKVMINDKYFYEQYKRFYYNYIKLKNTKYLVGGTETTIGEAPRKDNRLKLLKNTFETKILQ